jgi:hypothetical protein
MTLVVTLALLAGHWLLVDRRAYADRKLRGRLLGTALIALPLILVAIAPYLQLAGKGSLAPRSLGYARIYSASPTDFVLPPTVHLLWGSWVATHFDRSLWIEATLYLGVVAFALAAYAVARRKGAAAQKRFVELLLWTGVVAFVLALGTDLHWLSQPVTVPLPAFLQRWYPHPQAPIPLPGYLLFKLLPYYASMRVWMRYGIFVILFVSVLAGLGVARLLRKVRGNATLPVAFILLLLVTLDFYPRQQGFTRVEGRPVDSWLASQSGTGAVVQFPFSQVEDQEQIYYTSIYNKPFVGGFFNAFPPPQYVRIRPVMETFPSEESISVLRGLGVQYVLVDSRSYDDFAPIQQAVESLGLRFLAAIDGQFVYELAWP